MGNNTAFLFSFFIGLIYFGLIVLAVSRFHFKYVYGLVLPLAIVLFFFVMLIISTKTSPSGWEGLAYVILTVLALCILIGYLSGWVFVVLLKKAKD
jgi:hypothetical protein